MPRVDSKYQILVGPLQQLPHKCVGCGSFGELDPAPIRPATRFVDTGAFIEYFGCVYICETCFTEMANQFDFWSDAQVQEIKQTAERYLTQLKEALRQNEELRHAVASISSAVGVDSSIISSDSVSDSSEREELISSESSSEGESSPPAESDESNSESGSYELPGNDSLDSFLTDFDDI